uniref:Retrovirus-related Pol polyprotein from transposon gypsy n=1 Tax=Lygus hesperus TaxID=30085 RepID=A0A0A9X2N7_LYGHE
MKTSIQNYINQCELCLQCKYDRHPIKPKFKETTTPQKPFEIVHIDKLSIEKQKFLTIVDKFSKFGLAYPVNTASSVEVCDKLLDFIMHHGIVKQIVCDNGAEFNTQRTT